MSICFPYIYIVSFVAKKETSGEVSMSIYIYLLSVYCAVMTLKHISGKDRISIHINLLLYTFFSFCPPRGLVEFLHYENLK